MRKLMYVREHEIESHLVKRCKEKRWLCWKFISPGLRGVPDRIVMRWRKRFVCNTGGQGDGRNIDVPTATFIELKAPGEKPTPQQERRHAELRAVGFDVVVLSSKPEVDWWVDSYA